LIFPKCKITFIVQKMQRNEVILSKLLKIALINTFKKHLLENLLMK